jgi:tetratricopeptide (TPR) repeat protein
MHCGRMDEAAVELTRALEVDPLLAAAHHTFGRLYNCTGQPDQAITHLNEALALQPGFSLAHAQLGHAYLQKAMPAEAVAAFEMAALIGGALGKAHLAYAYSVVGRRPEATGILSSLLASGDHLPPFHVALAHAGRGDHEEAFRWLERASEEHDPWLTTLNIDRAFEPLRSDSRFAVIVRRMGLEPETAVSQ